MTSPTHARSLWAARDDEQGALILSRFAGATLELRDALVVNPYDTEQLAESIRYPLEMEPEERRARMQRMRRIVRGRNIYRWAGNLITELCEIRLDVPEAMLRRSDRIGDRNPGEELAPKLQSREAAAR